VEASLELKMTLEFEGTVPNSLAQEQLARIKKWLDDIEKFFLWHVLTDQMTPVIEATWLTNAEMLLKVVSSQLEEVHRLVARGDSNLESKSG